MSTYKDIDSIAYKGPMFDVGLRYVSQKCSQFEKLFFAVYFKRQIKKFYL